MIKSNDTVMLTKEEYKRLEKKALDDYLAGLPGKDSLAGLLAMTSFMAATSKMGALLFEGDQNDKS